MLDRDGEIAKQKQLANFGLAAEFYGKFLNGCCYEYLDGIPLDINTIKFHTEQVAQEMARWHLAAVQDDAEGKEMGAVFLIKKWLKALPDSIFKKTYYGRDFLLGELNRLLSRVIDSPVRFCHNDVLAFNIIYNEESARKVKFIDYEYGAYNARGFDFGNHFCEYAGFELDYTRYPRKQEQMKFINAYLKQFYGKDHVSEDEAEHLYVEANHWSLVSHFKWSVWGLYQGANSKIDFDFVGYANKRFAVYFLNRDTFLSSETKEYIYKMPN